MFGSICGGDREEAERRIEKAHCSKHDNFIAGCKDCEKAYFDILDENFMAVML